ncbi:nickel pincer cofactor biosynthesis protein LarB [Stackebrandtia albiflava]|uniref:nickel pincer cofactor biosynthesis protein LarB n=1 Tax=Stackebrandtia albiflava TaxID=406432 RepID=UPI001FCE7AFB|nr:nickel pincer cofactor biosynthesis protein LarB [Stackebrandtia albiflava]
MTPEEISLLLHRVADGTASVTEAAAALTEGVFAGGPGYADLGFAKVDTHRPLRTGEPETVFGDGKTPEQLVAITERLLAARPGGAVLATRLRPEGLAALRSGFAPVETDESGRTALVGTPPPARGTVAVVSAGTSDQPVAGEVVLTARAHGLGVVPVPDVGVAGLHRVLRARPALAGADCVVVVAGMDGALPSVVGGLVPVPVVAVPTSVGYGAAFGGLAALLTMLNSCAPGVTVVNIDNGFGAAVAAARIVRAGDRREA